MIVLSPLRFLEEAKAQAASNHWGTVMKESSYNDSKKTAHITSHLTMRVRHKMQPQSGAIPICWVSSFAMFQTQNSGQHLGPVGGYSLVDLKPWQCQELRGLQLRSKRRILKCPHLEDTNKDLHHSAEAFWWFQTTWQYKVKREILSKTDDKRMNTSKSVFLFNESYDT